MVERHLKQPHRFVCVDDSPFPGWWAKVSLFEPGRFDGQVLYLDLDVTVTGPLGDLADMSPRPQGPSVFCIMKDPYRIGGFNSSVMAWEAGRADHIFRNFTHDAMGRLNGDQNWIQEQVPEAETFLPSWVVSYKKARASNEWPDDMRVCVFHGDPKPWSPHEPIPEKYSRAA